MSFPDTKQFEMTTNTEDSMVSIEAQRVKAEITVSFEKAIKFPRNEDMAVEKMMKDCNRLSLADNAVYRYTKGAEIEGPTIRLAETVARHWGNISHGIKEIGRDDKESLLTVFCHDLETNYRAERSFKVPHQIKAHGKIKQLKDPRDIYEHTFNMGSRRLRAAIMQVIPAWVFDKCVEKCKQTQIDNAPKSKPDKTKYFQTVIKAFGELGVSIQAIRDYVGEDIEEVTSEQIVDLKAIYNAIQGGASPNKYFNLGSEQRDAAENFQNKMRSE